MTKNALQIGMKVRFLDDVGQGTITKIISEKEVMVEDENGFEYAHACSRLIVVENQQEEAMAYERAIPTVLEILQQEISSEHQRRLEKEFNHKYAAAQANPQRSQEMEVDLHIHALVDSQTGLTPATMLELQLAHFERMLQIGIRQRLKKIIFIHGIGQGVLRHQIWTRIEQYYPDCTCRSGDPRQYGNGASEVWIGQSAFQ